MLHDILQILKSTHVYNVLKAMESNSNFVVDICC
jgi:hypothetical protein